MLNFIQKRKREREICGRINLIRLIFASTSYSTFDICRLEANSSIRELVMCDVVFMDKFMSVYNTGKYNLSMSE